MAVQARLERRGYSLAVPSTATRPFPAQREGLFEQQRLPAIQYYRSPTLIAAPIFLLAPFQAAQISHPRPGGSLRSEVDWVAILQALVWGTAGLCVLLQMGRRFQARRPLLRLRLPQLLPLRTGLAAPACRQTGNFPFDVLGVRVHAVQIPDVVAQMENWIRDRSPCHSIAATSMHGIVEAQHDPLFKEILNSTDLVVPDGTPLVWLGRRQGKILPRRVYGPELMLAFCEKTAALGYRHFFYGGAPGVPQTLAESLKTRFPSLEVAGTLCPPFRPLTAEEDQDVVSLISRSAPHVLWVGLGATKQERWMHEHRSQLQVPVQVGVGAAFDLLSGRRRQAPHWMRENGLEWMFRLLLEPRRLWRRYLVYGPQFVAYLLIEHLACADSRATNPTTDRN